MSFDPSKYPKTTLSVMLKDEAFAAHHEAIKAFLTPKPKTFTPVEGKVETRMRASSFCGTTYPKGYVRLDAGRGNGCLYKGAAIELRDYLNSIIDGLKEYGQQ